jgi:hypothetical protein
MNVSRVRIARRSERYALTVASSARIHRSHRNPQRNRDRRRQQARRPNSAAGLWLSGPLFFDFDFDSDFDLDLDMTATKRIPL